MIAKQNIGANEHGIYHRRGLAKLTVTPIPDLRSENDQPFTSAGATSANTTLTTITGRTQFQGLYYIYNAFATSVSIIPRYVHKITN